MIERRDDVKARPQTLCNPPLIVVTLAPITSGNAGPDADTHRDQVVWVDRQGAIACRCRLSKPLRGQKEPRAQGPPIGIPWIGRQLLIGVGVAGPPDRGAAIFPNRAVLRRETERLVIAGDGFVAAFPDSASPRRCQAAALFGSAASARFASARAA